MFFDQDAGDACERSADAPGCQDGRVTGCGGQATPTVPRLAGRCRTPGAGDARAGACSAVACAGNRAREAPPSEPGVVAKAPVEPRAEDDAPALVNPWSCSFLTAWELSATASVSVEAYVATEWMCKRALCV